MFFPVSFFNCRRALAAGCALACFAAAAHAQDRLVFKDNHVEEGKVVGMSNGSVLIKVAAGELSYNLGLLARVEVAPPASFAAGYAAYQAGEWDRALAALKPIADQFKGLPTEWASQAVAALGDIYIEKNDLPKAVAAYNDYRTYYPTGPGGSLRMNLAQARVAFAQNNFPVAEKELVAIRDAGLKRPAEVTKGSYQAALVDYLRTVTLFYEDGAVTARAQKSADTLRAAHQGIYAP
jgi:hypothetical protein